MIAGTEFLNSSLIEGIGNDVLLLFLLIIVLLGISLLNSRLATVHHNVQLEEQEVSLVGNVDITPETSVPSAPGHHEMQVAETLTHRRRVMETEGRDTIRGSPESTVDDVECPICLGTIENPVVTNCGHIYCPDCAVQCWQRQRRGTARAFQCSMCRQIVTRFRNSTGNIDEGGDGNAELHNELRRYNRRFDQRTMSQLSWNEYVRDNLIPRIMTSVRMDSILEGPLFILHLRIGISLLLTLVYIISPWDIIPEAALGVLGYLDDFLFLILIACFIFSMFRERGLRPDTL